MDSDQKKSHLAILFADISGSTALYEELGNQRALQLISRTLKALIREAAEHHGTLVKTIGDEIMCTFLDVTTAIRSACAMQVMLEEQRISVGHDIYVRIGVHYGEVIVGSGDIFGVDVNVASRVANITRARQILTTQAVADLLPAELREKTRHVMRAELKGKNEALNVFQFVWEKDDALSTRVGMSAFHAPSEVQSRHEIMLRYRQKVLVLNKQTKSAVLGRSDTCDLVVQNHLASRQHAQIKYSRGRLLLIDQSSNGTFLRLPDNHSVQLHRQQIVLHGSGAISLGQAFSEAPTEVIEYILQ